MIKAPTIWAGGCQVSSLRSALAGVGGESAAGRAAYAAGGAVTAGLCVPAHCSDLPCSRARDPGRRRKGEESESAPRETLAQGAFQLCRLQPGRARTAEAQQRGRRPRPHLPEPRSLPFSRRCRGRATGRAATTKTPPRKPPNAGLPGGRSAAAAAPRRLGAPLVAGPPESGAQGQRDPAAADAGARAIGPRAWRVVRTRAYQ
ncbi:uncharacterized protein LOC123386483 [Felis catus]|uniref:uncharacterized protein LOC123386483 n=1 Tax=Felis catus TaxID=9685 RepID=UPI001D19917A|nr:uncharacterized protein LOC123386483 [Felis catus]